MPGGTHLADTAGVGRVSTVATRPAVSDRSPTYRRNGWPWICWLSVVKEQRLSRSFALPNASAAGRGSAGGDGAVRLWDSTGGIGRCSIGVVAGSLGVVVFWS